MSNLKKWALDTFIRAVKTFAEVVASLITIGAVFSAVDWKMIFSTALVSFVYTIFLNVSTIKLPGGDEK